MDYKEIRNIGKKTLFKVLKNEDNVNIIEKNIYINSSKDNFETEYKNITYQICLDVLDKKNFNDILNDLNNKKIYWNNPCFENISNKVAEQNDFIVNPFNVEEGALKCNKCNSKRVLSYSRQVRSSDESTSVFAHCIGCKAKWVIT
jgi:DNA-directed RNA polymerase subunit M/transcription elongation factor TFIIS